MFNKRIEKLVLPPLLVEDHGTLYRRQLEKGMEKQKRRGYKKRNYIG